MPSHSAPRHSAPQHSALSPLALSPLVLSLALFSLSAPQPLNAQASNLLENNGGHFRFGNIRWRRTTGNTVQITLETAWRRDYGSSYWKGSGTDGLSVTGDIVGLNGKQWPVLNFGDDSMSAGEYLKLTVTAYSIEENWIFGHSILTHTYATPNNNGAPWEISFTGCCKLSEINNAPVKDAPWKVVATADLQMLEASPRIAAMPVTTIKNVPLLMQTPELGLPAEIVPLPASFYAPGYDPMNQGSVAVSLAAPTVALTGAPTSITTEVDSATGKVTLMLSKITDSEAARNGQFYSLMLNASLPGSTVQVDFLIRIQLQMEALAPKLSFGHMDLGNLMNAPNLSSYPPGFFGAGGIGYTGELPDTRFYPEASYEAFLGFQVNYSLVASDPQGTNSIGFTVVNFPDFARMRTVKGRNPVEQETYWVPCQQQIGRHVTCYEAVDNNLNASTPECVDVHVFQDPAPTFVTANDDGMVVNMTDDVVVTLGAAKHYEIAAYDRNCLDSITLGLEGPLPEGAMWGPQMSAPSPRACPRPAEGQSVRRMLTWLAPYNFGGDVRELCFTATDVCGRCNCAGRVDTTRVCVTFRVTRCKYSVGNEHQLAEVAFIYNTDWLQLWKQNPQVLHPDYILFTGQSIDIGRMLVVGANENLYNLAQRYGTTEESIYELNYDLQGMPDLFEGQEICIIPNSCAGQSDSVLSPASEYRAYQCSGFLNTNGAIYQTLELCRTQCGADGLCSSISKASGL